MIYDSASTPSYSPQTGEHLGDVPATPLSEVEAKVARAALATSAMRGAAPALRANWMRAVGSAISAQAERLGEIAHEETGLGEERMRGEAGRSEAQWDFYATVAEEGSYLDVVIEHATETAPEIRRVSEAAGPVAVFGASNFPFAYGALGHDAASAFAAGAPIVVKAHPAHPRLSAALEELVTEALAEAGAPEGAFAMVYGFDAGVAVVEHPAITAVGFTGSERGGLALQAAAQRREIPIPVFAEMGTINPVVLTDSASSMAELAQQWIRALAFGTGQVCTKPGLVFAPRGSAFAEEAAAELQAQHHQGWALTEQIAQSYRAGLTELEQAGAQPLARVSGPGQGWSVDPALMTVSLAQLQPGSRLLAECFGPVGLICEYEDIEDVIDVIAGLQGALTASIFAAEDSPVLPDLVKALSAMVGRLSLNAWTSGVSTGWAQHHGGPFPATTVPTASSVGAAALRRFVRPVAYQSLPPAVLPPALHDGNPWHLPRRIDGRLTPEN
ncbi:aldehyde dehydrogenase family protein [Bogoriella caseilytica]|uniref:NADP-dependent aldehyde dehydrogenase n=1 Tax=Bogoriella caseilytica TaxID=56055 RepID=A0A3N2BDI6_9MICO|nr:aldehyde dehydrogenase family protein [Bogoriella caseilytica]ROR73308.1 NADP-dependent aldehyde dehydrogenase [Bogoriella caseilytica]